MLGKLVRLPLRILPRGLIVPILSGPLRGNRWIVGAGVHAVWLGRFETQKLNLLQASLKPGDTFYDVGAHAGLYALAAAASMGGRGTIVAVEPDQGNAANFVRHMRLNGIRSVQLIVAAASETSGRAPFRRSANGYVGRLDATGDVLVQTVRLDDLEPPPAVIKIDVEGHEASVLRGASRILATDRPRLFIAVHSPRSGEQCLQILKANHYDIEWLDEGELVARPQ